MSKKNGSATVHPRSQAPWPSTHEVQPSSSSENHFGLQMHLFTAMTLHGSNAQVHQLRLAPRAVLLQLGGIDVVVMTLRVRVHPAVVGAVAPRSVGREEQRLAIGRDDWVVSLPSLLNDMLITSASVGLASCRSANRTHPQDFSMPIQTNRAFSPALAKNASMWLPRLIKFPHAVFGVAANHNHASTGGIIWLGLNGS